MVQEIASKIIMAAIGQVEPPGVAASSADINSVWDFVVKGGPVMIPIGLCSLVALAVIVERLVTLRQGKVVPLAFLRDLKSKLEASSQDHGETLALCERNGSPIARILAAGLKKLDESKEAARTAMQEAAERVLFQMRKYLKLLSLIASISTLLGLLGTIFGMITAFQTVAATGEALGRTELLAKGIYEALITTAAGLLVAIPTLVGHHWIAASIESLFSKIDYAAVDFLDDFGGSKLERSRTKRSPKQGDNDRAAAAVSVGA